MTDPIQHLRELVAKATPGEWTAPHSVYSPESVLPIFSVSSGQPQVAESVSHRDAALIVALRNLAPQLLEVVESARDIAEHQDLNWSDTIEHRQRREARLLAALAALGGKGE